MNVCFALIVATCLAADPGAARATYYLGEARVTTPEGKPVGDLVLLIKREQFPAQSKIVETMLMLSSNPREPAMEYVSILSVDGSTFRMKEQKGTFSGSGELTGKPWEWTAWTMTTQLPGGMIRSRSQVTERGLAVVKEVAGPDGVTRLKYVEDHATIDGGTYELFHDKLLPKSPK